MSNRFLHFTFLMIFILSGFGARSQQYAIDFYEESFNFSADSTLNVKFNDSLSNSSVISFYEQLSAGSYQPLIRSLLLYRTSHQLNDWLYYQLIRKTAEALSPKKQNYNRYTLYKWFLMTRSGYDARIAIGNKQLIFYVKTLEDIEDIPYFTIDGQKYMCLNYHDYGKLFERDKAYLPVPAIVPDASTAFSYKVTRIPDFKPEAYHEKQVTFNFAHKAYHFNIKVTNEVANLFQNYPVVDFEAYFNIPLSKETYNSLIPVLKANVKRMPVKKGVDYLMHFTRYAFLYADDESYFGKEKRFSPEQTLLSDQSDCDDRAALFFYLVKEIYDLPMIAVLYPTHITMAVQFDKPTGKPIIYKGKAYTVCEPTPQRQSLRLGELAASLKNKPYEIVYCYEGKR